MTTRFIVAVAAASCCAALTIGMTAASARETPCCSIKSINARTRMVTVTEKKTSCTYEFEAKEAKDLAGLKIGTAVSLDVTQLRVVSEPTGSVGSAATSSGVGSGACGSNVARNAKTKTLCKQTTTNPNSWTLVPC